METISSNCVRRTFCEAVKCLKWPVPARCARNCYAAVDVMADRSVAGVLVCVALYHPGLAVTMSASCEQCPRAGIVTAT